MVLTIEVEREDDGRWLAEVLQLPGVMAYGRTDHDALLAVKALALRVIADRMEHGEDPIPGAYVPAIELDWLKFESRAA